MRIGICTSIENILQAERVGYDFIEPQASRLFDLTDKEVLDLKSIIDSSKIGAESYNCLVRKDFAVFGDESDRERLIHYLRVVLGRVKLLGGNLVIMGSGQARQLPDGLVGKQLWDSVAEYLILLDKLGREFDIEIVVEPLNNSDCNVFNYVSECAIMCSMLNLSQVSVLADMHHMICGKESYGNILHAGELLRHAHISYSHGDEGREFVCEDGKEQLTEFMLALKQSGFNGRISVEADCDNVPVIGKIGHDVVREVQSELNC